MAGRVGRSLEGSVGGDEEEELRRSQVSIRQSKLSKHNVKA